MKVYYLLYVLNEADRKFFFKSIKSIKSINDIDYLIKDNYYRVWQDYDSSIVTNSTIILEAWLFIKYLWKNYNIKPNNIIWLFDENLVILNETLFIQNWSDCFEVLNDSKTIFCTSRYDFYNPFWFLWEKITKIKKWFPKLIYPNKKLDNYYKSNDKIGFIINIYEDRKELIWDFMISLFKSKTDETIKWILNLWKNKTKKDNLVIKLSWWTDNWKYIKLIDINQYIKESDKIDYIKQNYLNFVNEHWSNVYFIDYYDIEKEYRLYLSRDKDSRKYKLYSLKNKVNLTKKDELFDKENFSTWTNIKVKWELWDRKNLEKGILKLWKKIMKKNDIDISVIELVKTKSGEYRFLEINTLGWSMMFSWSDEKDIKNRIKSLWGNIIEDNIIKKDFKNRKNEAYVENNINYNNIINSIPENTFEWTIWNKN